MKKKTENDATKKPSDYVIASGKQYTVKQFASFVLDELKINYNWTGKSIYTKCVSNKQSIVECDKNYYRQLEVDSLL